jgi:hypothetical protein
MRGTPRKRIQMNAGSASRSVLRVPRRRNEDAKGPTALGLRLKAMCAERRIAPSALSLNAGFGSREQARHVIVGLIQEVSVESARKFARALNVRTEWLISGREPREPYEGDAAESPPDATPAASHADDPNRDALADLLEGEGEDPASASVDHAWRGARVRSPA